MQALCRGVGAGLRVSARASASQALCQGSGPLAVAAANQLQQPQRRSVVHWVPASLDMKELKEDMGEFAERVELTGQDEYPSFRKEHRKRKEKRFDVHNKWKGRISQHKVRGLVEFIEFKRAGKYQ